MVGNFREKFDKFRGYIHKAQEFQKNIIFEPSIDRERVQSGGQNNVENHNFRRILHHFEDAKIHVDQYFLHDLERVFCMFFAGLLTRSRCIVGNFRESHVNTHDFQKRHF